MKGSILSARYAKSLLGLAIEQNALDAVYTDMQAVKAACADSRDLALLLKSPVVKTDKKQSILKEVFGGMLGELSMAFINLLTDKRREYHLEGIASAFITQYKAHNNITTATVTSAVALSDDAREKLRGMVKQSYPGQEIELQEQIDASLIGGFVIRVADKQVDASIKHSLREMQMEFNKNPYVKDF